MEVTIPVGTRRNGESRSCSRSADWDTALTSERPPSMNCLVKFLIGRRVYLHVMIGVSIALGLAALVPASAQTTAVPAAQTPTHLPAWALGPFKRFADINPIITPRPASVFSRPMRRRDIHWEMLHTFNPAAITVSDRIAVLYRAEDDTGQGIGGHTSRLGLWTSIDGTHPTERFSLPVLYPDNDIAKPFEWDGGCEDPRLVQAPDGTYVLTYVAWNRSKANICIAPSRDLHIWKKHGPAFNSASPTDGEWTKSGAIVLATATRDSATTETGYTTATRETRDSATCTATRKTVSRGCSAWHVFNDAG